MLSSFKAFGLAAALSLALGLPFASFSTADEIDGVVRVRSGYRFDETIARIKQDIAQKGILFFDEINQSDLAAKAGIKLSASTLR